MDLIILVEVVSPRGFDSPGGFESQGGTPDFKCQG